MTIAELERKVGISNGQIRKWGNSTPGVDKLQLVADYFNVSVDYLLGRTESKEIETIAAHHEGEEWSDEELEEIERFKEFIKAKRSREQ